MVVRCASTARDWCEAAGLLREYVAWIESATDIVVFDAQPEFAVELSDLRRVYSSPRSTLLIADDGDRLCGTLAVRTHDDGSAELKRMYVRPSARGHGCAGRLLRAALDHSRRFGAARVWLETVPGLMDPAIGLYAAHGFRSEARRPHLGVDAAIVMARDLTGGSGR